MGKKKSNLKESENGNNVTKLSESPAKKSIYSGRSKASVLASLFFIIFIGILSIILGLIFIEINSSSKDLKSGILKHDTIKKETVPHHVKEFQSKESRSREAPPPSPPLKSESESKMNDKKKVNSDPDIEAEHVVKKRKVEEGVAKKPKASNKDLPINEEKLVEIEKQIVRDHPNEINKDKESKAETSKPSATTGKLKVEDKPEKPDDIISEEAKPEVTLKELYIEVEGLADDILQEDPQNSMVKELAPHLEGVLKDLEGGKLSGLRDSLMHIKIILSDLKERLEQSKRQKESDVSKPPKADSDASKTKDERVPVDEVIPDPVYIAPLGDADKDVHKKSSKEPSTLDNELKVETKAREEKKAQDQPKKTLKVEDVKVSQPSHIDREKQEKSESTPQEKKTKNIISEEKVVQSGKDSGKESKETVDTEKSKDNQQNANVVKEKSEKLKDKIKDEKSSKIEKSSEDKSSKPRQDKRKLSETEKEVKAEKVEESSDKKLKVSQEKVKRETKPSTVEDLNKNSDKNLDVKETKKLSENEEPKRTQKDTVKTPEQSSKESEQHKKSADKSKEGDIKSKDKDLPLTKKPEAEKTSEKHPKKEKISPDSKESKVKEKLKEQNLKKSNEETPTIEKASGKEKQVPGTDKEKKDEKNEVKSSTQTKTNGKISPETSDKTAKEVKSSEIDEKLKLASALEDENLIQALIMYDSLSKEMPKSPTVLYRRALVLDKLSVEEQSNPRLEQTIQAYLSIIALSSEINVPKDILKDVGLRCVARMNFRGPSMFAKEREVLRFLAKQFYDDIPLLNKVGIYYLMMNRNEEAGHIFERVLKLSPEDGLALVHYGFVLKLESTDEASLIEASNYLERGIKSDADGVHDVRMYYHLGDALQRLGQNERAYQIFDEGVKRGLFRSRYQRSIHNIHRLKAKPLWTPEETTYEKFFKKIQSHWKEISKEGKLALNINNGEKSNTGFREEKENLREKGSWKQLELFARGRKHTENCKLAPFTCSLIEEFEPAAGCKAGQAKFSVMEPGTHVFPHAGPTNCRLRSHLGLVTPVGPRMRVLNETLTWEEGKVLIFDDSFEHEVWHEGNNTLRLILIVDVWHPELTANEIKTLRPL